MADIMIYDEPQIRQMIEVLNKAAVDLDNVKGKMQDLARQINNGDEGALVGDGGTDLFNAVNNTLSDRIDRLSTKLKERGDFVERELEEHLRAVQQSSGLYR
ncbi:MAG: hypothetical protein SGI73_07355 [Chloroflexota bacterium]|nr:hypothetical protein [Chloroflexota bacterium]